MRESCRDDVKIYPVKDAASLLLNPTTRFSSFVFPSDLLSTLLDNNHHDDGGEGWDVASTASWSDKQGCRLSDGHCPSVRCLRTFAFDT